MNALCPHCENDLGFDPSKLANSWNLIRCFVCGGFSMIQSEGLRPKIIPAGRRKKQKSTATPPPFRIPLPLPATASVEQTSEAAPDGPALDISLLRVPDPLPDLTMNRGFGKTWIPFLSATLATLIVALGFKLVHLRDSLQMTQAKSEWRSISSENHSDSLSEFKAQAQTPDPQALILRNWIRAQALPLKNIPH